jgi:hypothetical protein
MNWFVSSYWGRGNNLESILHISPVADLSDPVSPLHDAGMQVYNSFSGCRNYSALHGGWDTHSSALGLHTQQWILQNTQDLWMKAWLFSVVTTVADNCFLQP